MTINYTPPSWKDTIITTALSKLQKDKKYCQNYRPISILNLDYKIHTSIIATRLQKSVPDRIDEDQLGLLRRDKCKTTLEEHYTFHKIQKNRLPAALISLDGEKAFDRGNWKFLYFKVNTSQWN